MLALVLFPSHLSAEAPFSPTLPLSSTLCSPNPAEFSFQIQSLVAFGIYGEDEAVDIFQTLITPLYWTEKTLVNQKNQNSKPSSWLGPEQHSFSPSSSPLLLPEDIPITTTDVKVIYEPSMLRQQISIST